MQSDVEDIERCAIVAQLPVRFREAIEWSDRFEVQCGTEKCDAELLIEPLRPDGCCDAICECVWTGGKHGASRCLEVLRLPCSCGTQDVIHALCAQVDCSASQVSHISQNDILWKEDAVHPVADGDVVSVEITAVDCRLFRSSGTSVSDNLRSSDKIFTFVSQVDDTHRRFDVVACDVDQACAQIAEVFVDPIQFTNVPWDPSHLEPCRHLYVVTQFNPDSTVWPALFVLESPNGHQVWQVCHLDVHHPLQAVHHRFPQAKHFPLFGNGRALTFEVTMETPGMCICCETGHSTDSDTVFSFTDGMQKLLHWMSFATEPAVPVAGNGKSGGEGGAAPCLYDRWCAAPQSHASSSQRGHLAFCGDQVGGPDYTEDNLDLSALIATTSLVHPVLHLTSMLTFRVYHSHTQSPSSQMPAYKRCIKK